MVLVRALDDLAPFELSRIGAKARSCATLRGAGFDVPDGFVVHCEPDTVPAEEVGQALVRLGDGPFAVRSSALEEDGARHSFAGVHETQLNVPSAHVAEAVRACLISMTSGAAAAYRESRGLAPASGPQSVLVQRMVEARVAGVGFTRDPIRDDSEEMVISASYGSGEAVVGGLVEPDEIRVHRPTRGILSQYVGSKSYRLLSAGASQKRVPTSGEEQSRLCVDAARVAALSDLLLRIEAHFGAPQDVEWADDGERLWVLQSRPITAAVKRQASHAGIEWSRTNVREVMPDLPSPQALDLLTRLVNQALNEYFGGLLAPEAELGPMIKAIGGRAYFNLTQFRHLARNTLVPPAIFMKAMGHADGMHPEDGRIVMPPIRRFLGNLPTMLRIVVDQTMLPWRARRMFAYEQRYLHDLRKVPMEDRSDEQLLAIMDDFYENGQEPLRSAFTSGSFLQWQLLLEHVCERIEFPPERLLNSQLAVGEKTISSKQAFELLRIANIGREDERVRAYFETQPEADPDFRTWGRVLRGSLFKRELQAFFDDFGHRGIHETDWSYPRYNEDPTPILFAVSRLVTSPETPRPEDIDRRLGTEAAEAWRAFREAVPLGWREVVVPCVAWALRHIKGMYVFRERNKFEMLRLMEPLRDLALVMARRFVQRGWIDREDDYFMLLVDDVKAAVRNPGLAQQMRTRVAERRAEQARWAKLDMPLLLRDEDVPSVLAGATEPAVERDGVTRLRGQCTSPGKVEAQVIVMRDPSEFGRMRPGAIIVAPATDPSWTPMFTLAAGVVVEIGGSLSHASTIAREYGLPALANCKDATRLLRDGERVRLDATAGFVERL